MGGCAVAAPPSPPRRWSKSPVHSAICDHCDRIISGLRLKCASCPDFDLCYSCWGALQDPLRSRTATVGGRPSSHRHPFFFVLPIPSTGRPVVPAIEKILQSPSERMRSPSERMRRPSERMQSPRQTIHWSRENPYTSAHSRDAAHAPTHSLSLSLTHTHTHTHTRPDTQPDTHSLTHSLTHLD